MPLGGVKIYKIDGSDFIGAWLCKELLVDLTKAEKDIVLKKG